MTDWQLIAQTTTGPVAIQQGTEAEIRAEYEKRRKLLAQGWYSDEVRDFAIGHPDAGTPRLVDTSLIQRALNL